MQDEDKNNIQSDKLEEAYKQTIYAGGTSSSQNSNLFDEKQKISKLVADIDQVLDSKKSDVEKRLGDLKILKTEIEAGLDEIKSLEAKKTTLQNELAKIDKIEADEKQIETEVASF